MSKRAGLNYKEADIVNAIKKAHGMVSGAAKILGCHVTTIWRHKDSPKVAAAFHEAKEATLDFAELKLIEAMQKGEAWAVCFFLKTQGKSRGYIERSEVDHSLNPQTLKALLLED